MRRWSLVLLVVALGYGLPAYVAFGNFVFGEAVTRAETAMFALITLGWVVIALVCYDVSQRAGRIAVRWRSEAYRLTEALNQRDYPVAGGDQDQEQL